MADHPGRAAQDHLLIGKDAPIAQDMRSLEVLAARLQGLALAGGISVGTAESCTGGLIGHGITSIPGSSAYYRGGFVCYADAVKVDLVGVPADAIEHHGAVSAQVAVAMAEGARERLGCDIAVAVTGVAGPDGGTEAKPVGLTYVAVASTSVHQVRRFLWSGDRSANKLASAAAALEMLILTLGDDAGSGAAG